MNSVDVKILTERWAKGAIQCMTEGFIDECQLVATHITRSVSERFYQLYIPLCVDAELSVVAIRGEEVVGCCLNEDLQHNQEPVGEFPEFLPIDALVERLLQRFHILALEKIASPEEREEQKLHPGVYYFINLLAIKPSARRKGIATHLVKISLDYAKQKGFRVAVTQASTVGSQRIFRKLGFEVWEEQIYDQFQYQGQKPFASIGEPRSVLLMIKKLE